MYTYLILCIFFWKLQNIGWLKVHPLITLRIFLTLKCHLIFKNWQFYSVTKTTKRSLQKMPILRQYTLWTAPFGIIQNLSISPIPQTSFLVWTFLPFLTANWLYEKYSQTRAHLAWYNMSCLAWCLDSKIFTTQIIA